MTPNPNDKGEQMRSPVRLTGLADRRRGPALAVGLGAVALVAAACGGAAASTTSRPASNSGSGSPANRPIPGASGQIAALTPPSMEVQNPETGQTTVSWTSSTTFTQTVTGSLSTVTAGDCVSVSGTPSSPGSSSSPITARTVSITPASSSGSCTSPANVFGSGTGGSGFRFSGRPPSGSFPGGGSFPTRTTTPGETFPQFSTAFGQVSSVSSSGFVVSGTEHSATFRPGSSKSTTTTTTPPKTDITVTTSSSTTVSQIQSASASNLSVGECVTAIGSSSSTGAVAANTISIRQPVNGECFGGFGGGGGGGFGGGFFGGGGGGGSASND